MVHDRINKQSLPGVIYGFARQWGNPDFIIQNPCGLMSGTVLPNMLWIIIIRELGIRNPHIPELHVKSH